jgi:hypothetical protein
MMFSYHHCRGVSKEEKEDVLFRHIHTNRVLGGKYLFKTAVTHIIVRVTDA